MTEAGTLSTLRAGRRVASNGALADDGKLPLEQRAKSAVAESPRFVVLDFRCAASKTVSKKPKTTKGITLDVPARTQASRALMRVGRPLM